VRTTCNRAWVAPLGWVGSVVEADVVGGEMVVVAAVVGLPGRDDVDALEVATDGAMVKGAPAR